MVNSTYREYNSTKHSKFTRRYGPLSQCPAPPPTKRSASGVIYPQYGETDTRMNAVNQLSVYNQIMNIQAQNYEYYLDSGMGPY
jgi:hypothetical protein